MACNCGKRKVTQVKKTIKPTQKPTNGDNSNNTGTISRIRRIIRRAGR